MFVKQGVRLYPTDGSDAKYFNLVQQTTLNKQKTYSAEDRMMPPPGLQIQLCRRVTRVILIFDLLTPMLIVSSPCPVHGPLVTSCANLQQNRFICFQMLLFTILLTHERTNERPDIENIMNIMFPASLAWHRYN